MFIIPTFNSNTPPPHLNPTVMSFTDEYEKASVFNNYFKNQTILDDTNADLPELPPPSYNTQLSWIVLTPLEVESVLKTLKTGKRSQQSYIEGTIQGTIVSFLFPLQSVLTHRSFYVHL